MWKNGRTPIRVSSSEIGKPAWSWVRFATRLRWVSITPLGRPVVPLEYGSTARSFSASISASGAASGSPSRSANGLGAIGLAEHVDLVADPGELGGLVRSLEEGRHRQQHPRAGVVELVAELLRRVQRVDRRALAADGGDAVEGDGVLGRVGHVDGEHVAVPEPALGQAGAKGADLLAAAARR